MKCPSDGQVVLAEDIWFDRAPNTGVSLFVVLRRGTYPLGFVAEVEPGRTMLFETMLHIRGRQIYRARLQGPESVEEATSRLPFLILLGPYRKGALDVS